MNSKPGKLILIAFVIFVIIALVAVVPNLAPSDDIQKALADTRATLHAQGCKTDLTDFDLTSSGAARARADDLAAAGYPLLSGGEFIQIDLLPMADTESVAVAWKLDYAQTRTTNAPWSSVQDQLDPLAPSLDASVQAALAGPFRFNIDTRSGLGIPLPHITTLLRLSNTLATRTLLDLRNDRAAEAWTNLLALIRLTTGWQVEPIEVSQLMRGNLANTAFGTTWQLLQKPGWTDAQLAALQQEWTNLDCFAAIPETVAFRGAVTVELCERNRDGSVTAGPAGMPGFPGARRSPIIALANFHDTWQEIRYRGYGTYADEKNLLLYNRDRLADATNALRATNWLQMEALPGVTNSVPFKSPYPSRLQAMLANPATGSPFRRLGGGLFARAAVIETRRRLLLTALALDRYHLQHGNYPTTLAALIPDYLPPTLALATIDFMDGNPLRYHVTADGQFTLYSVGLDGVDNGGTMKPVPTTGTTRPIRGGIIGLFGAQDTDLVWPRPATDAQIKTMNGP